jgi:ferrous iron transport protein B
MAAVQTIIAIAGNPNSGKTTAFNWYTGSRQHVGNYPGITVEKKEGAVVVDGRTVTLVDLPGTYSLSAYSLEEMAARQVLAEERPGAVLDVVNAGVLERNLYLTVQLLEMGVPVVVVLNMMDEATAQGITIDVKRLEELTGVRAIPAVARSGEGLEEALRASVILAEARNGWSAPLEISYGADIDEALKQMEPIVVSAGLLGSKYPARWVALKYLERDEDIIKQGRALSLDVSDWLAAIADKVAAHVKTTLNTYPEALIADYRYGYISSILKQGVLTGAEDMRIAYSDKADLVLTHRVLGPLIMLGVLYLMYFLTIKVGAYPLGWVESAFAWLGGAVGASMEDGILKSLITDGIIGGVGGVLGFVPLIMIMFLFIAILEDSGYMARVAYMMDRVFRFFGLHGASVMPFIVSGGIAGGCAVPGVMSTRTLRSPRERLATMLTAPFMACGAKVPVFLLLVTIFFENHQALVMFLLTLAGWVAALLVARLLRSTLIRGEATPFVMELPPYRLPTVSGLLIHTWERTWQYIKKAGTIILAISILIWAAMSFPALPEDMARDFAARRAFLEDQLAKIPCNTLSDSTEGLMVAQEALAGQLEKRLEAQIQEIDNEEARETLRQSYAGRLGVALEGITGPAGFDWRTNIALIGGIAAKEVIISTLGTVYSLGESGANYKFTLADRIRADKHWTKANAIAMLLFTLLYSPCLAALAVIRKESGEWKWMFFSLFFNLGFAYAVAVAANQLLWV